MTCGTSSEQLIPMFGLTALEHVVQPKSTLEKLFFLLEHAFTRAHELTTLISFGALGVLVGFRMFKQAFKRYWFIYRLPEVFVVVVASTSAFSFSLRLNGRQLAERLVVACVVLSDEWDWDKDGVEILGSVPISTGTGSLIQFPLRHVTLKFLRKTTSTAVYVAVMRSSFPVLLTWFGEPD